MASLSPSQVFSQIIEKKRDQDMKQLIMNFSYKLHSQCNISSEHLHKILSTIYKNITFDELEAFFVYQDNFYKTQLEKDASPKCEWKRTNGVQCTKSQLKKNQYCSRHAHVVASREAKSKKEVIANHDTICQGITKKNTPCKKKAVKNGIYCATHGGSALKEGSSASGSSSAESSGAEGSTPTSAVGADAMSNGDPIAESDEEKDDKIDDS